ncbi:ABC transporter substrate-binding protein [Thermodesulfobacteriota bacterium]
MKNIELTGAFGAYDRTAMLSGGVVSPEGIDLRIVTLPPVEIFFRMCRFQEFDVSEMSMGAYCYLLGKGGSPFVGMPAFPSRAFRHSMVYVNTHAGIEKPEDLNGKRIGIREWGMTAVIWIVGIMGEEYGLDMTSIDWVAVTEPRVPIRMPTGTQIRYVESGQNLSDMLDSGEIDAAFIHQIPDCFSAGSPDVKRLFPEYREAEIEYFERTGVHPIMHCVVLREDIYQHYPWALRSLYKALLEAKQKTMESLLDSGALAAMIPFLPSVMADIRRTLGQDYWPYGVDKNQKTLEKLLLYAFQQGLTPRILKVEELFEESVGDF